MGRGLGVGGRGNTDRSMQEAGMFIQSGHGTVVWELSQQMREEGGLFGIGNEP